jgi:hypothetical protein
MDTKHMRNYIYLRGMLDTFQKRAIKYYSEGATYEEKFARLKQIRELLFNRGGAPSSFTGGTSGASTEGTPGAPWLTVAGGLVAGVYPNCEDGEVCRGGVCQDPSLPIVWGDGDFGDPTE